ncbi:MAG TPA: BTAD domain-containing putative transcriptional regulator [Gaiellales bacterium]|jgi:predicted ATPase/DNA-binding SARP family transcriptional activator|nr:BTAD domain-containing putative transcriptional regulator [Gaiellales bacterium]
MEFGILGPLEVLADGTSVVIGGGNQRSLLGVLLLHPNEVVSVDRLIDLVWDGQAPPAARTSVHVYVSALRKALGEDVLFTRPPGYVLRVRPGELDAERFETVLREARSSEPMARATALAQALALWRGPPLADFTYDRFAAEAIGRLEEARVAALEERIAADLELGRETQLIGELRALIAEHPLRERLRAQLMLALYRAGRQAEALELYQQTHRLLGDTLGLEPTEELQRLERAILNHDPQLEPEAAAAARAPRRDLPQGTVTLLFCDVEGSTRVLETLGASYANALAEHRQRLREALETHAGVEVDTQGDAFFAVFATATDAVAAALDAQRALADGPLRVRMGVHTGEPVLTDEGYVGMDVHRAARICAVASGGQVLISQATRDLVQTAVSDLGEQRLRDIGDPVRVFQLGDESFPPLRGTGNISLRRPTSSFVGREREVSEVVALLRDADTRLLTLTGAGGSGKTRLALEVAHELWREFRDGAYFVALAPLAEAALVGPAIADALANTDAGKLGDALRERRTLLVLDNFEHVLAAAPLVTELLEAGPHLKILVTSRELLLVEGEIAYRVPALAEPEAVALFCARARIGPSDDVRELCRRLDSLPLAIELAAARTNVLSPAQMLGRLAERLDLLKARRGGEPRQNTLRASIAWSFDLLAPDEQQLLARLAVFAGGCTNEAAEAICAADLDTLQALVEKSLLQRTGERFWLLETIREFAWERLEEGDERDDVHRRLAEHFVALAETAQRQLRGPEQELWFRALVAEQDNFRAALSWAVAQQESTVALRLATALEIFWRRRGQYQEGARWFDGVLALAPPALPEGRARALAAGAHLSALAGNVDVAEQRYEESIQSLRELGDEAGLAEALRGFAELAGERGRNREARAAAEESLELFTALNDRGAMAGRLRFLGELALDRRAVPSARDLLGRALTVAREAGDDRNVARTTQTLADLELSAGNLDAAEELYRSALLASRDTPYQAVAAHCLLGLAAVAGAGGEAEAAGALWSAGERLAERLGMRFDPSPQARYEHALGALDPDAAKRFAVARAAAATLTIDQAIASV